MGAISSKDVHVSYTETLDSMKDFSVFDCSGIEEEEPKELKYYTSKDLENLLEGFECSDFIIRTLKESEKWNEMSENDPEFIGGALEELYRATIETDLNSGHDILRIKQGEMVNFLASCGLGEGLSRKILSNVIMKKIYDDIKNPPASKKRE